MSAADVLRLQSATEAPTFDRADAIKRARTALAPSMKNREVPTYPVDALGPLADVCKAIAIAGQVQPAMVGQCLVGAASLLTQGLFNVETLAGRRPLSAYLLTLGDSGDGKSLAHVSARRNPASRFRHIPATRSGVRWRLEEHGGRRYFAAVSDRLVTVFSTLFGGVFFGAGATFGSR